MRSRRTEKESTNPMEQLHQIREQLYKEEKGLSLRKKIQKTQEEAEKLKKEFGVKLRRLEAVHR